MKRLSKRTLVAYPPFQTDNGGGSYQTSVSSDESFFKNLSRPGEPDRDKETGGKLTQDEKDNPLKRLRRKKKKLRPEDLMQLDIEDQPVKHLQSELKRLGINLNLEDQTIDVPFWNGSKTTYSAFSAKKLTENIKEFFEREYNLYNRLYGSLANLDTEEINILPVDKRAELLNSIHRACKSIIAKIDKGKEGHLNEIRKNIVGEVKIPFTKMATAHNKGKRINYDDTVQLRDVSKGIRSIVASLKEQIDILDGRLDVLSSLQRAIVEKQIKFPY